MAAALLARRDVLWTAVAFSAAINVMALTSPIYMMQVYDRVIASGSLPTLLTLTVLAFAFLAVMGALDHCRARLLARLGVLVAEALARPVLHAAHRSGLQDVQSVAPGQSLQDLDRLRQTFAEPSLAALLDAPFMPFFLLIMWLLHPVLAAIAVVACLMLLGLAFLNDRLIAAASRKVAESVSAAKGVAIESIADARTTIGLGMVDHVAARWVRLQGLAHADLLGLHDRSSLLSVTSKTARQLVQIVVLGAGALLVIEGMLAPSMIMAASIILGRMLAPVEQSISQWRSLGQAFAARRRIDKVLEQETGQGSASGVEPAPGTATERADLVVDKLVVHSGIGQPILRGISFALPGGATLGVLGRTGAGKSTLLRTIVAAQTSSSGLITLGGVRRDQWSPAALGRAIGYLPQDAGLLNASIAENIARFDQQADERAILAAAMLTGVHDEILRLKDGYATRVGRGGRLLASGLRQRIALARAVYRLPRFVLLDEPNTNLDQQGESALLETLRQLKASGCTVVLVAHRPNLLEQADLLLPMEGGQAQAFGRKADVLAWLVAQKVGRDTKPETAKPASAPAASAPTAIRPPARKAG